MKYVYSKPSIEVENDTSALIHFDILNTELTDFYKHVDSIHFIQLETTDEALIGRISQLFIVNNTIFVADYSKTKSIFAFDMQGRFLYRIHKFGQGPGDYSNINMVHINDSSITINDWISWKIIQYDLRGNLLFEGKAEPHPYDFIEMNNREMLFYYSSYEENKPYQLVFTDSTLQWKETALPHLNNRGNAASAGVSFFQKIRDGNILFHMNLNDTIYQISLDKQINTKYHLGFHTSGEVNEFREKTKDFDLKKMNESLVNIVFTFDFFELDDMFYIQYPYGNNMFISIVQKNDYRTIRSLSYEYSKNPFLHVPFLICGYHQNSILGYFDSEFFQLISKENIEYLYSKLNEEGIHVINSLKKTENNPVVVIINLKKI